MHSSAAATPNSQLGQGVVSMPGKPEALARILSTAKDSDDGPGGSGRSRRRVLYTPQDDAWLSESLCLIRRQIEAFPATPDDVKARKLRGGRKEAIPVGRVGIRCVHCAHLPPRQRAKGAVAYPDSVRIVHQAVRNWQRYHFLSCAEIPNSVKEEFLGFTPCSGQTRKKASEYWINSCRAMGMVDADGDGGIRFEGDEQVSTGTTDDKNRDGVEETNVTDAGERGAEENTETLLGWSEQEKKDNNVRNKGVSSKDETKVTDTGKRGAEENTETLLGRSEQEKKDDIVRNKGASSKDEADVFLETLGNDVTPLDAIDSFDIHSDFASLDIDIFEHLDFSQKSIAADTLIGRKNRRASITSDASHVQETDPVGGCHNEPNPDNSLSSLLDTSKILPDDSSAKAESAQHNQESVKINETDRPDKMPNFTSVNIEGLTISAERDVQDERTTLLESVRLALELVRTVRAGHETGLTYKAFNEGAEDGSALSGDHIRADLVHLGVELYKLFSGFDIDAPVLADRPNDEVAGGDDDAQDTRAAAKKKERRPTQHRECVPLRDHGLPVSLSIVVSSLLDAEDIDAPDRYQTIEDVEEDLRLMNSDPERYLFDASAENRTGQLEFVTGKLYGRQHQISSLEDVFGRSIGSDGPTEMALVSGYSGTGKTVLVDQLRQPLAEKNGHFVAGKFDKGQTQPMSVIFMAFNDFCNGILQGDEGQLFQIRTAIAEALGPHASVLIGAIPSLQNVIGEPMSAEVEVHGKEAQNRFYFCFRLFVRAIASSSHPVIFFLDDLQWADKASLELVSLLVSDSELSSFLFIGSYRDNEVGADHPIMSEIVANIALAGTTITNVKLENMDRVSVNEMISDAFHLLPRLTSPLANIVHAKTSGNPLFAVQFLRSLCEEQLLRFSASSRRWEWDVEMIQSKDIADNVVDLMKSKVLTLDHDLQRLLKDAACLGSRSEASTLKLLTADGNADDHGTMFLLDSAVSEGILSRMGTSYKFSHDQIQHAVYSLIPDDEVDAFHLRIGRLLWRRASPEELNKILFIAVDQLQRGQGLISYQNEKNELAQLFLRAGEKAIASSAFLPASIYLLQGIGLLDIRHWETHYDLSLQLFSCCAEAQSVLGNMVGLQIATAPVFVHGRSLEHKKRAYLALIKTLATQGKHVDAIRYGLDVLAQLGEHFPNELNQDCVMRDFAQTRAMCEGVDFGEILQKQQVMEVNDKLYAMRLLNELHVSTFQANQSLSPLLSFRMVQLSLSHGFSPESPFAFACFGVFYVMLNDFDQAYRYGKLALSLLDRISAKQHVPIVYSLVYFFICNFKEPMQATLPPMKHAFEIAMKMGNMDWALYNATSYVAGGIQGGINLEALLSTSRSFLKAARDYKNVHSDLVISMASQAALNLMGCSEGHSEGPTILTGEFMKQEDVLAAAREIEDRIPVCIFYGIRMWLAYLFRRYTLAAEMVECYEEVRKSLPIRGASVIFETFYAGLIAVSAEMSRSQGNECGDGPSKWRQIAYGARDKMKVWAKASGWNCQHKLDLLNAEIAYLNCDMKEAAKFYTDAIRNAGEHGYHHEQALACERAGMFYSKTISGEVGMSYLHKARNNYLKWGAKKKADCVLQETGEW